MSIGEKVLYEGDVFEIYYIGADGMLIIGTPELEWENPAHVLHFPAPDEVDVLYGQEGQF